MGIGEKIKVLRKAGKMTQEQLAEWLQDCERTYYRWIEQIIILFSEVKKYVCSIAGNGY